MKLLSILGFEDPAVEFFALLAIAVLPWVILYYVIKAAVKNGILESKEDKVTVSDTSTQK